MCGTKFCATLEPKLLQLLCGNQFGHVADLRYQRHRTIETSKFRTKKHVDEEGHGFKDKADG